MPLNRKPHLNANKSQKYAVKTMKKAEIIKSKHVDHIENEKNILEKIQHPFVVSISNDAMSTHLCLHGYYLSWIFNLILIITIARRRFVYVPSLCWAFQLQIDSVSAIRTLLERWRGFTLNQDLRPFLSKRLILIIII